MRVLGDAAAVPGHLTLAEAERFELAALAALHVRVEYWIMLRAVWSAVWEPAIRAHVPRAKLLDYDGHLGLIGAVDAHADPSVAYAWAHGTASGVFDLGEHGQLCVSIALVEDDSEIELRFYCSDRTGTAT